MAMYPVISLEKGTMVNVYTATSVTPGEKISIGNAGNVPIKTYEGATAPTDRTRFRLLNPGGDPHTISGSNHVWIWCETIGGNASVWDYS